MKRELLFLFVVFTSHPFASMGEGGGLEVFSYGRGLYGVKGGGSMERRRVSGYRVLEGQLGPVDKSLLPDSPPPRLPSPRRRWFVFFDFADYRVKEAPFRKEILKEVKNGDTLTLYGYTDSPGREKFNNKLSEKRARAVAAILEKDLEGKKVAIRIIARGECCPLSTQNPSLNRRVEIFIDKRKPQTVKKDFPLTHKFINRR